MRTIETALWPLEKPTEHIGLGVFLGEEQAPALVGLYEEERVLLVEPNELQAEGTVRKIAVGGRIFWFGEIGNRDAIQVIYPDAAAPAHASAQSGPS